MRWIFRLIGGVVVLVILAVVVISLIPAEKIAGFASQEITARTGRQVSFSGKIKPVFFPVLGVKTGGITIGNASWSDSGPMLTAESLRVGVDLMPLLSGQVQIKEFRLTGANIRLEKNQDGRPNWELEGPSETHQTAPSGANSELPQFSLKLGQIIDGTITYSDHQSSANYTVNNINLDVSVPNMTSQTTLSGSVIYNNQKMEFATKLNGLAMLLSGGVTDISLGINGPFGAMDFRGQAGMNPLVAKGSVEANLSDASALDALLGTGNAVHGFMNTAGLRGNLTYSEDGTLFLRETTLQIDENTINADADLTLSDRPFLTAKLTAGDLDFSAFTKGETSTTQQASTGWSTSNIDLSGLHALNADIGFAAASINLGTAKTGETRLRLKLDAGRLVFGLNRIAAYGGNLTGEYVINARNGLSMGGDIKITDVQLQPLLMDMADYDRLIAATSGQVKFLTSGRNMDAMMHRLSGSGRMDIGAGEIIGLDLLGMLRNLDSSYRGSENKTIFTGISGSFEITDGVLANDDLNFASGLLDASGSGQVDIAAQRVNYRLVPVAFSGEDIATAGGLSVPVLIDGPWSNLNFRPDLQGLFDAELDKQRAELEARAKANLEEAAKETEQRIKDELDAAVKKAAEDALKKALGLD